MAARLGNRDLVAEQRHRDIIRTTCLLKRLQSFTLGEADPQNGKPIEMSSSQVKAAVALLKKTMPDLQSIEGGLDLTHYKHEEALKDLE
jgi:hypothetical protein